MAGFHVHGKEASDSTKHWTGNYQLLEKYLASQFTETAYKATEIVNKNAVTNASQQYELLTHWANI
jgi:hypothetical protein